MHHHAKIGPYNTQHIITLLDALNDAAEQDRSEQPRFVVVWDNVCFHRAVLVRNWYTNHKQFEVVYSPFLNPIEGFFRLEDVVYDRQPHARMPLLQAMEQACGDIEVRSIHGWIRHTRRGSISPPTHNCRVFLCLQYSCEFFLNFCYILA